MGLDHHAVGHDDGQAAQAVGVRSAWATFWIASVATFLVGIDTTVLFAALRAMRTTFPSASAADLSWVVNAYTVAYAGLLVPAGRIADAQGRRKTFLAGLAVFDIASAACGLSGTVTLLIAARTPASRRCSDAQPGVAVHRPGGISCESSLGDREPVGGRGRPGRRGGSEPGSFVVDVAGWPWAFYLNVPLGAAALWFGRALLPKDRASRTSRRIDVPGTLMLMAGVAAVTLDIVQSDSNRWTRAGLAATAVAAILLLVGFVRLSQVASTPSWGT
jgi:MFS family permease